MGLTITRILTEFHRFLLGSFSVLLREQTDRQTDTQTDRLTHGQTPVKTIPAYQRKHVSSRAFSARAVLQMRDYRLHGG